METAHGQRREDFEAFLSTHPELKAYAEFCGDGDAEEARYHRFVQYAAATQLGEVAARARRADVDLYLDLPVGVHPHGYDTWAHPELFAAAQVGAPPDSFFAGGQAWGFPPLHPERLRRDRYAYFISALRHVLQYARAIRVDHILGLQRLYWIPSGADPSEGGYVRYHDEELRAILAIEAQRADATVVGEDLGTVSPKIRAAMDRDGILHTFVYQFDASAADPLPQPRRPSVASVGSHDLPRFAAFWRDPEQRELAAALGTRDPRRALRQCLEALAAGPAAYVVVDVADLEGEVEPDNRPGTGVEAGNWRRRLPRPVQELAGDKSLRDLMSRLAAVKGAR
jgi:4-alpha-glucanotransferase